MNEDDESNSACPINSNYIDPMPDCYLASWEIIELYCNWNPTKNEDKEDE
jgi:hypothetical protein